MTKLRMSAAALMLTLCGVAGAKAQSDAAHVLDAMFYNFDENRDGVIDAREANRFIANSFAEMDPHEKHAISHRADAFRQLMDACLGRG